MYVVRMEIILAPCVAATLLHEAIKLTDVQKVKKELAEKKADQLALCWKRGAKQRYFSRGGGLQLAAHRCISNCGAYALGLAMSLDVHCSTVTRYEVLGK